MKAMPSRPLYIPRYTVDDYRRWSGDWQLIDGVAIAMTPSPFGPHERVVSRLSRTIGNQIEAGGCPCEVYTNLDWIIDLHTVVQPDIMVVCGEQPQRHLERPPAIVVEVVSEATRAQDLVLKRALYREHEVRHYLVIDPAARSVEHVTAEGSSLSGPSDRVELLLGGPGDCRLVVDCSRLFD